jgi:hypothetical protein
MFESYGGPTTVSRVRSRCREDLRAQEQHVVTERYHAVTMIRTQIQLTEEQAEKAKRLAAERGVSIAEVIRQLLDAAPATDDRTARLARALDAARGARFRDREGRTDVALRHDTYLADVLAEELER